MVSLAWVSQYGRPPTVGSTVLFNRAHKSELTSFPYVEISEIRGPNMDPNSRAYCYKDANKKDPQFMETAVFPVQC